MSENKHTDGDWTVGTEISSKKSISILAYQDCPKPPDDGSPPIHAIVIADICPSNEAEANAHLIAAAPEILTALEKLVFSHVINNEISFEATTLLMAGRKAIAKARGET